MPHSSRALAAGNDWLRLPRLLLAEALQLASALRDRWEVRRLATWEDHALKDIGLTRADVDAALASHLWERPSRTLLWLSRGRAGPGLAPSGRRSDAPRVSRGCGSGS